MPIDSAKNDPDTSITITLNKFIPIITETFSAQTVGTVTVNPYIYSYSTQVDPLPRALHSMIENSDSLYVFGGQTLPMGRTVGPNTAADYSNEMLKYDLTTQSWSTITTTNTPTARCGAAFFKYTYTVAPANGLGTGTFAFLLFGYGDVNGTPTHIDSFHSYNFGTATWTVHTTLADTTTPGRPSNKPSARQKFAYVIRGNLLYIFGGLAETPLIDVDEIWTLNMDTFQWTFILSDTLLEKNDFDVAVIGDVAYVFGGESNFTPVVSQITYNFVTQAVTEIALSGPNSNFYNLNPNAQQNQINNNPNLAATLSTRPGAVKGSKSFVLGNGGYANEVVSFFMIGGWAEYLVNQSKVCLYQYDVAGNSWNRLTETVLPYTQGDMDSVSSFAMYTTGLAINYQPGAQATQTSFDYEVYVDDGYSAIAGANYHTGLWKILIRQTGGTYSFISATRLPGKGTFTANIPSVVISAGRVEAQIGTSIFGPTLSVKANYVNGADVSFETLIVRP